MVSPEDLLWHAQLLINHQGIHNMPVDDAKRLAVTLRLKSAGCSRWLHLVRHCAGCLQSAGDRSLTPVPAPSNNRPGGSYSGGIWKFVQLVNCVGSPDGKHELLYRSDGHQMVAYSNAANLGRCYSTTSSISLQPHTLPYCGLHLYIYRVQKMVLCSEN